MLIKTGKRFKPEVYRQFWRIFKGTKSNLPNFTSVLSAIKNEKYLGTAAHLTERAKTGAVIFIKKQTLFQMFDLVHGKAIHIKIR